jgi:hypothetical protein
MYLKSNPKFTPFGCEWHEPKLYLASQNGVCPAELQNLETLRRHIRNVHGHQQPSICRWAKCADQAEPEIFGNAQAWEAHMEEEHLISYAWHMGDGIKNDGIETPKDKGPEDLPDYLFKDGKQVTPSITDQEFENTAGMLERKRKLREIRRQAEANAPTDMEFRLQLLGKPIPPRLRSK